MIIKAEQDCLLKFTDLWVWTNSIETHIEHMIIKAEQDCLLKFTDL